jgi:streptogramin lyase
MQRPVSTPKTAFMVILLLVTGLATGQPENAPDQNPVQNFVRDGQWAGGEWDGNTMWVTTNRQGEVYVLVRAEPHVRIFDREGNFLRAFNGEGAIANPHSITVDKEGNVWITETYSHIVVKFSPEGLPLMTLGERDQPGDNDSMTRFQQPNHVFIHDNGDIYVSDGYVNSRIVQLGPDGKFRRIIGGVGGPRDGEFQAVHGVVVDADGRIIANDSENFRVNVFNKNGKFLESWPYQSRGGIEILDDRIYVSDVNQGAVYILDLNGRLLDTAYAPRAHGMGVDSDGTIYTSGASHRTVFKLTPKTGSVTAR